MILIKLAKRVDHLQPGCLPTMEFKDTSVKAIIAGYGKNRRPVCQVGPRGPTKFRYCGVDDACKEKGARYKNATCDIAFPYKGNTLHGCQKNIPSPSSRQAECIQFFKQTGLEFQDDIDEFEIYDSVALKLLAKCYRTKDDQDLGWCGTYQNDDISQVNKII